MQAQTIVRSVTRPALRLPPALQGVSFTTVPIATSVINTLMKEKGLTFEESYGKLLGTLILCSIIPSVLSFFPIKLIKKVRHEL